jgi:CDGSH-type Zn-finger protein
MMYTAEKDGEVWFCGCKATSNQPMCDGSHNSL